MFQWSHGFSTMETIRHDTRHAALELGGFNGATVFQPWRRSQRENALELQYAVSMEPRFFNHGDLRLDTTV